MIVAGVDEAGRGSVLGPLVVAAVSIEESKIGKLRKLGVRDSKLLTPKRRRELFKEIKAIAREVIWRRVEPKEIDDYVVNGTRLYKLNYLEAKYMAKVLTKLSFGRAYVDCCDTNRKRYGALISNLIDAERDGKFWNPRRRRNFFEIVSEHHADVNYPIVSAASIVAKVKRDFFVAKLRKAHGDLGTGYPSDPETLNFLKEKIDHRKRLPDFVRFSWFTIKRLQEELKGPFTLDDFEQSENNLLRIEQ